MAVPTVSKTLTRRGTPQEVGHLHRDVTRDTWHLLAIGQPCGTHLVVKLGVSVHGADVLPQGGEPYLGVATFLLALLDGAEV